MSCCLLTATKPCPPLSRASQQLFQTAGLHPAMDRNSPTKMPWDHSANCGKRFSFALSTSYTWESQQHESHCCGHRALRDRRCCGPSGPRCPAGPAASSWGYHGFWVRRFPRRPRPGLTAASVERPISRSPTHGPTCRWQTTRASLTHLRWPQRRHPAGTDSTIRLQSQSSPKRPTPGRGRPGAGAGCPAPAP